MIRRLLLLSLSVAVFGQPLSPFFHMFLPHPQQYPFVMQQLFDLRGQIRECRGHLICDVKTGHDKYKADVTCLDRSQICDTIGNCPNRADESDCPINCHGLIRCRDDCTCARPCDGNPECPDGEDEKTCERACTCGPGKYLCSDGKTCISRDKLCDGNTDCKKDGDDETGCPPTCACLPGFFQCTTRGNCIESNLICNGDNDCDDGEDEVGCGVQCTCKPGEFFCANGLRCIPRDDVCNDVDNECCLDNAADCAGPMLNEDLNCPPPGMPAG